MDEAPGAAEGYCAYHHVVEPVAENDIVCGECWHRFTSPQDVENFLFSQFGDVRPYAEIYSCPLCVHDF